MLIESTRLGVLEVDDSRIITFEDGLLGFPEARRFALIQTSPDPIFFWLQSLEFTNLAFLVCDPVTFVPDYQAGIRRDDAEAIGLEDMSEGQVLTIVNRVNGDLTANLLGPLVISARTLRARQLVLSDKRYGTRHRLVEMGNTQLAAQTA